MFGNEVSGLRVLGLDTTCSPAISPAAQKLFLGTVVLGPGSSVERTRWRVSSLLSYRIPEDTEAVASFLKLACLVVLACLSLQSSVDSMSGIARTET